MDEEKGFVVCSAYKSLEDLAVTLNDRMSDSP